jgi:hypothetical protein
MAYGGGRAGNGWDGHLPSDKMEMAILNAMEGIEDEDGNKASFLNTEEPEVRSPHTARSAKSTNRILHDVVLLRTHTLAHPT